MSRLQFFPTRTIFECTTIVDHPSHPDHPLSLFPSPTYISSSFICISCQILKSGSGFCFSCSTCEFDLHIHCAYNDLNPKSVRGPSTNQIKLKSHPNHSLHYLPNPKVPYANLSCSCDVCGTTCDPNSELYHCYICRYDAHVGCTNLPELVQREDHEHELSLLHMNPYVAFQCDVCRGSISKNNCMYHCKSGCDYGIHVNKCVSAKVSEKNSTNEMVKNIQDQLHVSLLSSFALRGLYLRSDP